MLFYRTLIRGAAASQLLQCGLFWGSATPWDTEWDPEVQEGLGEAVAEQLDTDWIPLLWSGYKTSGVYTDAINERGVVVGDFPSLLSIELNGTASSDVDSVSNYAVCQFRCRSITPPDGPTRVPKRTYIAYGPLTNGQILSDGALALNPALTPLLRGLLTSELTVGERTWYPYRVTQTEEPLAPGVGRVESVVLSPYAGTRKSRRIRPSG